jgi:hypothetical protein
MDVSIYFQPRRFRSPYRGRSERVGGAAVLWTLLLGPVYLWRKGAMVEALVLAIAGILPFLPLDGDGEALDAIGSLVWLAGALLAPVLLAMSYERRGWTEAAAPWDTGGDEDGDAIGDGWSREPPHRE